MKERRARMTSAGITRRKLVIASSAVGLTMACVNSALIAGLGPAQARGGTGKSPAEDWMDRWSMIARAPGGPLQVSRFKEPLYFLLKPISWTPNAGQAGYQAVEVPTGFVTDFASIPRAFWSLLRPDGDYV